MKEGREVLRIDSPKAMNLTFCFGTCSDLARLFEHKKLNAYNHCRLRGRNRDEH